MRFQDKSAIVTGAAAGIGAATAKLLAAEGAAVVVADIDPAGEEVAAAIRADGGRAWFVPTDVTRSEDARRVVERTVAETGRLDILHNNAGILVIGDVTTITEADWNRCLGINLTGAFLLSKFAVPAMAASGGGVIINTASVAGKAAARGYSVYSATKAALIALTECMALDFGDRGIRVNAVCPGPTATNMVLGQVDDPAAAHARWSKELPAGRLGTPEDTAKVVAYLASDDAAFVTGASWVVDGGRLIAGMGKSTVDSD